jgi:hypothetical protein
MEAQSPSPEKPQWLRALLWSLQSYSHLRTIYEHSIMKMFENQTYILMWKLRVFA